MLDIFARQCLLFLHIEFSESVLLGFEDPGHPYPGTEATIEDVLELADAYYCAATALFPNAQKGAPLSYAPARLCSIHAIELYLNAFLRHHGATPAQIRNRGHNLADPPFVDTLRLRQKTAQRLIDISERREYLISRYGPELAAQHTELTRLTATLNEVQAKVKKHLGCMSNN